MDTLQTTHHFRAAFRYCLKKSEFRSQRAVAEAAMISESSLSEMLSKKSYSPNTQAKIARVFGYDDLLDFLALGRKLSEGTPLRDGGGQFIVSIGSEQDEDIFEKHREDYKLIPLYESGKLAAGENGVIFDPYEEPSSTFIMSQNDLTGRKNHRLIGLRVGGESMSPVIPMGSFVIVDLDDRVFLNNKIYAVNYPQNGENIAAVKRVQKWEHGFVLLSSNPEYPPELSESDWADLCVGRTIRIWRSLEDL